jgi:hypothetical protein
VRSPGIVTVWIDDDCPFRHPEVLRVAKVAVVSRNTVRRLQNLGDIITEMDVTY